MLLRLASVAALLLSGLTAPSSASEVSRGPEAGTIIPRGYIVEFADDAEQKIAQLTKRSEASIQVHDEFHKFMARSISGLPQVKRDVSDILETALPDVFKTEAAVANISSAYTLRYSYDSPGIFRGLSVLLASEHYVHLLSKAPGVVAVSPISVIPAPESHPIAAPEGFMEQYSAALREAASTDSLTASSTPIQDTESSHRMIGVDRLHAEGFLGQGVTIGVLDSGVDYTHPALNGGKPSGTACFGKPECQVIGGKNFRNGDPNDPYDQCDGHGTYTSSLIAGRPSAGNNFTG